MKQKIDRTPTFAPATRAVHGNVHERQPLAAHAITTPIVQTATYTFVDTAALVEFMEAKTFGGTRTRNEYARYGNPSVRAAEKRLAALESDGQPGYDAILYPSGMTAVTNLLLSILPAGAHIVFTADCYRKTRQFMETFLGRLGIESTEVAVGDYDAIQTAIRPNTRFIVSESPTNPYLRVADLEKLAAIGRQHPRVKTLIDATFATPVNQRPLSFGIDFVVHSGTKYLSGHNDVLAGVVIGKAEMLQPLRQSQGLLGGILDPHAAFLVERGLKTLHLRIQQQNRAAQLVAEFLETRPEVERVWYPGLPSHPDHHIAAAQMDGFGGVVSLEIAPVPGEDLAQTAARFVDALQIPYIAPSLGGVESLVMQPALVSYYELSREERLTMGIKDNLVRFALGIESTADILADLSQALSAVRATADIDR